MRVCVIGGAGYVGLITSVGLAALGHEIASVDVDAGRIEGLRKGKSPHFEDGMDSLLSDVLASGHLTFSTDLGEAVSEAQIIVVAVGTPASSGGGADISQVQSVVADLAPHLDGYAVIAIKSTAPVGTLDVVRAALAPVGTEGVDYDIAMHPEFLREGTGLVDFFYPDRIIIGSSSDRANQLIASLYDPLFHHGAKRPISPKDKTPVDPIPVIQTDFVSAQMIKYASNAFLATRVSFVNEIASICESVGADVEEVAAGMRLDGRIGSKYLDAGLGFGGPCLEKDLDALLYMSRESADQPELLRAVLQRNDKQVAVVLSKARQAVGGDLKGKTVAVLGVAFKAGTNDVRNSLAVRVMDQLADAGATVRGHDPIANKEARAFRPAYSYFDSVQETVAGVDLAMVLVDWPEFRRLDLETLGKVMAKRAIVDARNVLDPEIARNAGFTYAGVGR